MSKAKTSTAIKTVAMDRLDIQYVPIDSLLPNTYNPNRQDDHEFELLLLSMEEDGFTQAIFVTKEYVIIDGEHRWRAAKVLGYTEVPVVVSEMDAAQARVSTIRHNRARGNHDIAAEAALYREIADMGGEEWLADSLDVDSVTLRRMLDDMPTASTFNVEIPVNGTPQEITEAVDAARLAVSTGVAADKADSAKRSANESGQFRIMLMFSGDEARDVKRVLGTDRSANVVRLCTKYGNPAGAA